MLSRKFKLVAGTAIVLVGAIFAVDAWSKRTVDYDECMLETMKGQQPSLWSSAHRKCARRSAQEFPISFNRDDVSWSSGGDGVWITFKTNEGQIVSRGDFQFSSKSCGETTEADWIVARSFSAEGMGFIMKNIAATAAEKQKGFSVPVCMHTKALFGIYPRDPTLWERVTSPSRLIRWDE